MIAAPVGEHGHVGGATLRLRKNAERDQRRRPSAARSRRTRPAARPRRRARRSSGASPSRPSSRRPGVDQGDEPGGDGHRARQVKAPALGGARLSAISRGVPGSRRPDRHVDEQDRPPAQTRWSAHRPAAPRRRRPSRRPRPRPHRPVTLGAFAKVAVTSDRAAAASSAAPRPWTARAPISPPRSGQARRPATPAENTPRPTMKIQAAAEQVGDAGRRAAGTRRRSARRR